MLKVLLSILILLCYSESFADNSILIINNSYPGLSYESELQHKLINSINTQNNSIQYYSFYLNFESDLYIREQLRNVICKLKPILLVAIGDISLEIISADYLNKIPILFITNYVFNYDWLNSKDSNQISGVIVNTDYNYIIDHLIFCGYQINNILVLSDSENLINLLKQNFSKYSNIKITSCKLTYIGDLYYNIYMNNIIKEKYDLVFILIYNLKSRLSEFIRITEYGLYPKSYSIFDMNSLIISNCRLPNNNSIFISPINDMDSLVKSIQLLFNKMNSNQYLIINLVNSEYNYNYNNIQFRSLDQKIISCIIKN